MWAVKMCGGGRVSIVEAPDPRPDDQSVIVRVKATAICGSELHELRAAEGPTEYLNTGHEVVGVVERPDLGGTFRAGQRVGACVVQGCGRCDVCASGDETGCTSKRFDTGNGHSELFKLGLRGVRKLPDDVDWPPGAILSGDGLGVPVRCATRLGDTAGKRVVVLGLGPVGLSCVLVQTFLGARVLGVDLSAYRVDLARRLGAEEAISPTENDVIRRVGNWTDGRGADAVIVAAPVPSLLDQAAELVRRHGIVFLVGEIAQATFDPGRLLLRREATLMGSWYYTSSDWRRMLDLHRAGLPYHRLITHTFPFERAQEAFDTFSAGQSGKVVLTYGDAHA